jgi:hypothetical protein
VRSGDVSELFVFPNLFGTQINRTVVLTFLAAFIVIGVLYFAYRRATPSRPSSVPRSRAWSTWSATTSPSA